MKIVLSTEKDVGKIMALIKECVKNMASHGIYQWNDHYPNTAVIENDVRAKSMYAAKDSETIVGVIVLNEDQAPEYKSVKWSSDNGKVLVVHRLAVKPIAQNRGIGGKLLDYAEKYAIENGYGSIRLDSYSGNPIALKLYEKHHYRRVGQVNFPRRELPFYCFEKILGEQ